MENPALAGTLERLGREGIEAWRRGAIPRSLSAAARASGGKLTARAVADYRTTCPDPLVLEDRFLGETIITMPPPSSGGIAIAQILAMQERLLQEAGWPGLDTPEATHLLVESMKHAFAMRARESGNFPMWFGGMRSDPARSRRASAHHGRGVVFGVYA